MNSTVPPDRRPQLPRSLQEVLRGAVDYAGLFPPAGLTMGEAVEHYAAYLESSDAWALGRFVVPGERLDEFASCREAVLLSEQHSDTAHDTWALTVLATGDPTGERSRIDAFTARHSRLASVASVEARATTVEAVEAVGALRSAGRELYVEVPLQDGDALPDIIAAIGRLGAFAKMRTGGVSPQAFPTAAQVAHFLLTCASLGVAYKATAGLHHALRHEYPLTYAQNAPVGTMFGFLNVTVAGALAQRQATEAQLIDALEERDAWAFRFTEGALIWRDESVPMAALQDMRQRGLRGFGSCSFREPLDDVAERFGNAINGEASLR